MNNNEIKKQSQTKTLNYLQILVETGKKLSEIKIPGSAFSRLLETINDECNLSRSFVALCAEADNVLQIKANKGFNATDYRRFETHIEKSIAAQAVRDQKITFAANSDLESTYLSNFSTPLQTISSKSSCFVPIFSGRKTLGILGIEFEAETISFDEHFSEFLAVLATMLAQAAKVERVIEDEKERLLAENFDLQRELREKYDFGQMVGNSSAMKRVYAQVSQVARSNTTVLLRGESGTGKELIANGIHYNSLRAKKPFIKVNCAALPETLIESELFGYEKGAFTGANNRKKGRFELAEGGTIFLDEIGDLSAQTQIRLLRVLQEKEYERVGGTETIKANVRIVTATNKNLENAIADGTFREDLFYRLNVFTIFLPPLRERKSDILLLAENFVEKYEREHGKHIKRISTPAIDLLTSYHYPGNVRELENAIERAVLVCDGNVIHGHHLPPTLQTAEITDTVTQISLTAAVEAIERDIIQDALKTTRGNRGKAAQLLETTERILCYKIKKYNIDPRRFRD